MAFSRVVAALALGRMVVAIVNGRRADACEWRWQVGLTVDTHIFCGGVLIEENWVLTTSSCPFDPNPSTQLTKLRLGAYKQSEKALHEQVIEAAAIYQHPSYNSMTQDYDFSLIKLAKPAKMTSCVETMDLPDSDAPAGTQCKIAGWGTTLGIQPNILREAEVNISDPSVCNSAYPGHITERMFCANGKNFMGFVTDSCQGDTGGPMVCKIGGSWAVYGLASLLIWI